MGPIHAKAMPVLLIGQEAIEQWLEGTTAEALELQKPAPDDAVELLPIESAAESKDC